MVDTPRIDSSNGDCTERTMLPEYNKYQKYFSPLLLPKNESGVKGDLMWGIGVVFLIFIINSVDLFFYRSLSIVIFIAMIYYFIKKNYQNSLIDVENFDDLSIFRNSKSFFYINRIFIVFSIPLCAVFCVFSLVVNAIFDEKSLIDVIINIGLYDFDFIYDKNDNFSFLESFSFFILANFTLCFPSFCCYFQSLGVVMRRRNFSNKFEVIHAKRMLVEYGFVFFILCGACVYLFQEYYEYSGLVVHRPYMKYSIGFGMQNIVALLTVFLFYLFFTQFYLVICMTWKNLAGGKIAQ